MAAAAPDTSTLTSSEQIFTSYTLPQIRAIHKSLHVQIDEKSARLRTQVGNSYRELLGTADTIVQMKQEMRDAQEILGDMGGMCGRAVIGGKVRSVSKFRERQDAESELGVVARCRLLEACGLTVNRLMKAAPSAEATMTTTISPTGTVGSHVNNNINNDSSSRIGSKGGRLVLAAKVLVLGRLLVSSFGNLNDGSARKDVRDAVETAKKSLASLRRRLLKSIDRLLEKVGTATSRLEILNAMCAYSLASSSGAKDVMYHFLAVRAKILAFEFNLEEHDAHRSSDNVLRGLDLYSGTLLDVQALIPNKLSEALASMKRHPLLADDLLKSLETLRLDIYERWCGDDIHHFTPFIQHNDLEGSQARDMLHAWAGKGGETLLSGTRETLGHTSEFKGIVDLRTNVLQHWIKNGGKAKGFDPSTVLDGLRKVINDRLLEVLNTKVSRLRLVGSEVSATLEGWQTGRTDRQLGLWSNDVLEIDASENANHLTQAVVSRLYGRNEAVSRAVTSYRSWFQLVDDVGELVEHLKRQRWDNDVEEIEDEEVIEQRQKMLSKEDPQRLHDQLDSSLREGFRNLDEHLSAQWRSHRDGDSSGYVAMYLLRILRDIRASLPKLDNLKGFGLADVPELHDRLAACVSISPVEEFATTALPKRKVVGRALWDGGEGMQGGAPPLRPLPTNPSPGIFRLLRDLVNCMGDAGLDLWTPAAVRALKRTFGAQLVEVWRKELESAASASAVDVVKKEEKVEKEEEQEKPAPEDREGDEKESDEKQKTAEQETDEAEREDEESAIKKDEPETAASTEDGAESADANTGTEKSNAVTTETPSAQSPREGGGEAESGLSIELLVQWVYDMNFLEQCLRFDHGGGTEFSSSSSSPPADGNASDNNGGGGNGLVKLADEVAERAGLGGDEKSRLGKASQEYWKRSSLLFGLLA